MFFLDKNLNCCIIRVLFNGDNIIVIVYKGLIFVFILFIDFGNKMIYFVDIVWDIIEVCDYNGFNRRVICRMNFVIINVIYYYEV